MVVMGVDSKFIRENRVILPFLWLVLLLAFIYFKLVFRPSNPVSFPRVEERMWTASLVFLSMSGVFYAPELLGLLGSAIRTCLAFALRTLSPVAGFIRSTLTKSVLVAQSGVTLFASRFPALKLHLGVLGRVCGHHLSKLAAFLFSSSVRFLRFVHSGGSRTAAGFSACHAALSPSGPYYFVTLGVVAGLVLSPLVISGQEELAGPASLLFAGYAVYSNQNRRDVRILVVTSALFLLACPVFMLSKRDALAELAAVYAFYSISTAVLLGIASRAYEEGSDRGANEEARTAKKRAVMPTSISDCAGVDADGF